MKKDGKYQLALNSEKMYWIVEKMDNLFNKSDSSYIWTSITDWNETRTGIIYDHTLLSSRPHNDSAVYRKSEVDFGILPFPKYDKTQKEYISIDWRGLMCVQITIERTA